MASAAQTVLIVDDEGSHREMLCAVLRDNGYRCLEAPDGKQALKILERALPDLVVLDIRMPGLDGLEVLKRIRLLGPQLPVIMVTAFGEVRRAVEATKLGAFHYLEKPVDIEELCGLVAEALRDRPAGGYPVARPRSPPPPGGPRRSSR